MTSEFRPVLDTDYYISVEVQRKIEFQRLKCLLGLEDFRPFERCRDAPEALDITWAVNSGQKMIAQGRSQEIHGGFYSNTIARTIGQFRGQRGLLCTIEMTVNKDASELNRGNPKITVSVHPSVWEGDIIAQQLAFLLACVLAVAGTIFLLFGGLRTDRVSQYLSLVFRP